MKPTRELTHKHTRKDDVIGLIRRIVGSAIFLSCVWFGGLWYIEAIKPVPPPIAGDPMFIGPVWRQIPPYTPLVYDWSRDSLIVIHGWGRATSDTMWLNSGWSTDTLDWRSSK